MKILENLDSFKITVPQISSYKDFLKISRKLKPILFTESFDQRWKIYSSKNIPRYYSDRE